MMRIGIEAFYIDDRSQTMTIGLSRRRLLTTFTYIVVRMRKKHSAHVGRVDTEEVGHCPIHNEGIRE